MGTGLLIILIAGACAGGWALLALLGTERQRMLSEMEHARRRVAPPPVFNPIRVPTTKTAAKAGSPVGSGHAARHRAAGAVQKAR